MSYVRVIEKDNFRKSLNNFGDSLENVRRLFPCTNIELENCKKTAIMRLEDNFSKIEVIGDDLVKRIYFYLKSIISELIIAINSNNDSVEILYLIDGFKEKFNEEVLSPYLSYVRNSHENFMKLVKNIISALNKTNQLCSEFTLNSFTNTKKKHAITLQVQVCFNTVQDNLLKITAIPDIVLNNSTKGGNFHEILAFISSDVEAFFPRLMNVMDSEDKTPNLAEFRNVFIRIINVLSSAIGIKAKQK